jgi:cell division protein FtsI (penicillin-binding protein 3)
VTPRSQQRQRIAATAMVFAVVFAALGARAVQLTVVQGEALMQRASRQHRQAVPMTAQRGAIVDRYGETLALSRESAAVYLRPREWSAAPDTVAAVARLLDLPPAAMLLRASAPAPGASVARQVPRETWCALESR